MIKEFAVGEKVLKLLMRREGVIKNKRPRLSKDEVSLMQVNATLIKEGKK